MFYRSKGLTFAAALRDVEAHALDARLLAAQTLAHAQGDSQRDKAFAALATAIGDAHPSVRKAACDSLLALEHEDAWELLLLCLSDLIPEVRQSAAIALGELDALPAFEAISELLSGGPADMRFQAARALAQIDGARAYPLLIAALDDEDPQVLAAVAEALAAVGNRECTGHLAERLEGSDPGAQLSLACALAHFSDSRSLPYLLDFLRDPHLGWDAANGLEDLGTEGATALEDFLAEGSGSALPRIRAAGALLAASRGNSEVARVQLTNALRSRRAETLRMAVQELSVNARAWLGPWARPALVDLRRSLFRGRDLRDLIDDALSRIDCPKGEQP